MMKRKECLFIYWFIAFCSIFILADFAYAEQARITSIALENRSMGRFLVIQLTSPVSPHIFTLTKPYRLVLDFKDVHLSCPLKQVTPMGNIIGIREGYPKPGILRLVLDLKTEPYYKNNTMRGSNEVLLNLGQDTTWSKPMIIVIDPGHGGKDPGALGLLGTKEKNIVLAIAQELAHLINQQPNMRAVLTRNGDYFVALQNRLVRARKGKGDLFIAIHADSFFNKLAHGASVYSLSSRGASSMAANWLAKRENYSELGGVDLGELEDQSYLLRSVLIDLAQTETAKESRLFGKLLLNSLNNVTKLHYRRVEQAPFMVLKSPDIPSVLVEVGFISNKKEEIRLRDLNYQHKIALALLQAVIHYQTHVRPTE